MGTLETVLKIVGVLVFLPGWFGAIREMWSESRGYGWLGLTMPLIAFVYAILHWDDLQRPFWIMLAGGAVFGLGFGVGAIRGG